MEAMISLVACLIPPDLEPSRRDHRPVYHALERISETEPHKREVLYHRMQILSEEHGYNPWAISDLRKSTPTLIGQTTLRKSLIP